MVKLIVEKNEEAASIIERLLGEKDEEIILVIPKNSKLKESIESFSILKREADSAQKTVYIESVDEDVLSFGRMNHMESAHPLFTSRRRSVSDIVSVPEKGQSKTDSPSSSRSKKGKTQKTNKVSLRVKTIPEEEERKKEAENRFFGIHPQAPTSTKPAAASSVQAPVQPTAPNAAQSRIPAAAVASTPAAPPPSQTRTQPDSAIDDFEFSEDGDQEEGGEERPPRRRRTTLILVALGVTILVGAGVWAMSVFGAHATVTINFKRTLWNAQVSLTASKATTQVDAAGKTVPAEVFTDTRNLTQLFPATGKVTGSQKATGNIIIYNAYSSAKQALVATTRFMAPDGKVFRLDNAVVVPGAEVKNGKIIPASIQATVTADKPGPDYNIGPVSRLSIPGFKGSPKYDAFYGVLEQPAAGGFIGDRIVPTDSDAAAAKDKVTNILETSLQSNLLGSRGKEFNVLDGASAISVTRLVVKKDTDQNGQFSVFGEASYQAIGFREQDVKNMFLELANKDYPGTSFRDLSLVYSEPKPDYDKGTLTFLVTAQGTLATAFQSDELRSKLAGQKVSLAQSSIAKMPGLVDAKVSLWPIWLQTLPSSLDRIQVNAN